MKRAMLTVAALGMEACVTASHGARSSAAPSFATYCEVEARLAALEKPYEAARKENVSLELDAPYMPSKVSARGAAAMSPPGDMRMILVGPGGATALDLWLHGGRFRFAVPALERVIRGDASTPPEKKRGLPVDFLRWWMLDPFRGELLYGERDGGGDHFVLRDGRAYVDGTIAADGSVTAVRTTWTDDGKKLDEETLTATKLGCGKVDYRQASTELHVVATCESESSDVPSRAFVDPDEGAR